MFQSFINYIFNIFRLLNSALGFTLFCTFTFFIMFYVLVRIFKR